MKDIELLHPKAKRLAKKLLDLCEKEQLFFKITKTLVSKEEQNRLADFDKNINRFPYDVHCFGVAFDIKRTDYLLIDDDIFYQKVARIGKKIGLVSGFDYPKTKSKNHFELPEFLPHGGLTYLLSHFGDFNTFYETWYLWI